MFKPYMKPVIFFILIIFIVLVLPKNIQKEIEKDAPVIDIPIKSSTNTNTCKTFAKRQINYTDTRFSVTYEVKASSRDIRYGITTQKLNFPTIKLRKYNTVEDLSKMANAIFMYLPHIKSTDESIALVVETIIAESQGGKLVDGAPGDLGICQIRVETVKSLFKYCDYKHPDVKKAIMAFYDKKLSLADNLRRNTRFSIACCISIYWHKMGGDFYKHINSLTDRAVAWKSVYNTRYGAGTVDKYITRVQNYNT